jgi:hypothetical protein
MRRDHDLIPRLMLDLQATNEHVAAALHRLKNLNVPTTKAT